MQGLLGTSWDDPRTMATLALAQGLLGGGGGMQRLTQGMGGYGQIMGQAKQAEEEKKRRAMQEQMLQLQMQGILQQQQAQQAAMKKQQSIEDAYRSAFRSPEQMALSGGGGPTQANAAKIPSMTPQIDQQALIQSLMQADPMAAYQMAQPKPKKLMTVAPGATVLDESDPTKPLFSAPDREKEDKDVALLKLIHGDGTPAFARALQQLGQKRTTHQPGTSVSVNTGQKGFDNTLKLRGDFRSEPIYKAHQDVQSAHAQITTALKQGSPAGDMAGATKLMKILDPGSVVRESELGMAMAATGLLDRATNYAQMVISGEKLNPAQRKDFQKLADALFAESRRQYDAKRSEYEGIAKRNSLNVDDVLGPASSNVVGPDVSSDDPLGLRGGR